jgi:hypothetical protein
LPLYLHADATLPHPVSLAQAADIGWRLN